MPSPLLTILLENVSVTLISEPNQFVARLEEINVYVLVQMLR